MAKCFSLDIQTKSELNDEVHSAKICYTDRAIHRVLIITESHMLIENRLFAVFHDLLIKQINNPMEKHHLLLFELITFTSSFFRFFFMLSLGRKHHRPAFKNAYSQLNIKVHFTFTKDTICYLTTVKLQHLFAATFSLCVCTSNGIEITQRQMTREQMNDYHT